MNNVTLTGKGELSIKANFWGKLLILFVKRFPVEYDIESENLIIDGKQTILEQPLKMTEAGEMVISKTEATYIVGWWKDMQREQNIDEYAIVRKLKEFIG